MNKIEEAFQSLRPIVITEKRQLSKINITLIPPLPPSIRSYLLLCALYESSDILRRPQNFEKISKFFLDVTRYHQKYWKISFFFKLLWLSHNVWTLPPPYEPGKECCEYNEKEEAFQWLTLSSLRFIRGSQISLLAAFTWPRRQAWNRAVDPIWK